MTDIYKNKYGHAPDLKRCRASVYGTFESCQCASPAKIFKMVDGHEGEIGFCGRHDPDKVAARNAKLKEKREARWADERAKWQAREAERKLKDSSLDAIRQIAAGHSDPRALAASVLDASL